MLKIKNDDKNYALKEEAVNSLNELLRGEDFYVTIFSEKETSSFLNHKSQIIQNYEKNKKLLNVNQLEPYKDLNPGDSDVIETFNKQLEIQDKIINILKNPTEGSQEQMFKIFSEHSNLHLNSDYVINLLESTTNNSIYKQFVTYFIESEAFSFESIYNNLDLSFFEISANCVFYTILALQDPTMVYTDNILDLYNSLKVLNATPFLDTLPTPILLDKTSEIYSRFYGDGYFDPKLFKSLAPFIPK